MTDKTINTTYKDVETDETKIDEYIKDVLSLEAVACKDWLTNKVDRSVTGKIARQQCQGEIQLPRRRRFPPGGRVRQRRQTAGCGASEGASSRHQMGCLGDGVQLCGLAGNFCRSRH